MYTESIKLENELVVRGFPRGSKFHIVFEQRDTMGLYYGQCLRISPKSCRSNVGREIRFFPRISLSSCFGFDFYSDTGKSSSDSSTLEGSSTPST
mmetsp:Transcript_30326/g.65067  ORF Transcript_30326/g.65067 Transcript_30326/m.65067 type:complete len:95 (+) Transcript_30326:1344-1628(+)